MDFRAPVRKVLRATSPLEDESLVGAVRRCAFDNGLPSTGVLLREAVAASHAWSNLALRDDVETDRLAEAMRTAPAEIATRMHRARRAAPFVMLRSFHGTEVRGYDLTRLGRSASCAGSGRWSRSGPAGPSRRDCSSARCRS